MPGKIANISAAVEKILPVLNVKDYHPSTEKEIVGQLKTIVRDRYLNNAIGTAKFGELLRTFTPEQRRRAYQDPEIAKIIENVDIESRQ